MAQRDQLAEGEVRFHAQTGVEQSFAMQGGTNPMHDKFLCGACGATTNGRVICDLRRHVDKMTVAWCVCSCERMEPTVIVFDPVTNSKTQIPVAREFHCGANWPPELARLFDEAAIAYTAGAFTASGMASRKVLMACACQEGDDEGKKFVQYVDYLLDKVIQIPKAKTAIAAIKNIGNDANHKLDFLNQDQAKRSLQIVTYLLTALYSLPAA
jgi:Domain of unknown function (DUF4145)